MTSRTVFCTLVFAFLMASGIAWGVEETPARAPRVPWIDDLDWADIVTLAEEKDHPIIIDFTATWCGPCKLLDVMVFTEKEVINELADVIPFKVDIDKPFHAKTQEKFGVLKIPTVIWCDQKGREIDRFTGYKSSREFLEVVRGWQENRTIDRMLAERRAESPEDPEVLLDLARRHADRGQMREAEVLYRRLMNMREGTEERTVARGMLGLAEMAAEDGRDDEARDLARRAANVFLPPEGDQGDHEPDLAGML
jgi:thioredoxin-like negative regulator of GroEL